MRPIVALIDFADPALAGAVVRAARKMAQLAESRLFLLNVETPDAMLEADEFGADISRERAVIDLRRRHRAMRIFELSSNHLGIPSTAMMVRSRWVKGKPGGKILQELARLKPEYVVAGSHGRSALRRLFAGSVTEEVIRTGWAVLIIPNPRDKKRARKKITKKKS